MRTRLRSTLVLALAVVLVGLAPPAFAALAQVGVVSVTGASTSSLTLTWPKISRATAYDVYRSSDVVNLTGNVRVKRVYGASATITGMPAGKTYCFQVRAVRGSEVGKRSRRSCKPTIRSQGPGTGPALSVMTFNLCSRVCGDWESRQPVVDSIVAARQPDVVAVQEGDNWYQFPEGYRRAVEISAKSLVYKTSRLAVATREDGGERIGTVVMSPGRYGVWAELVDLATDKHMIFVSAHTSSPFASYELRGQETQTLLDGIAAQNPDGLPVVFAGDFNSHKGRGTYDPSTGFGAQDTVGQTFARAGYYDGYDLAATTKRPNWNSFHGLTTTPTIGYTWGDHVDHVYVQPGRAKVTRWLNSAPYTGNLYTAPWRPTTARCWST